MAKYKPSSYKISDIYQGGYSTLKPPVNNSYGSNISAGSLGTTTDPRQANQLKEVSDKLSMGVKQIEVTAVSPQVFDSIPKQQLKEIHRLSKLTGVDISMHGPVMDVAGISQQGFSETERELAERKVADALIRARELNPEKGIPVVFHSAEGIPASQLLPPSEREKAGTKYKRMIAVNRETGRMIPLEPKKDYPIDPKEFRPGVRKQLESGKITGEDIEKNKDKYYEKIPFSKGKYYSPEKRIENLNDTEWNNQLNQVFFNQERAQEILGKNQVQIQHFFEDLEKMKKEKGKVDMDRLSPRQRQAYSNYIAAQNYLEDVHQQVNGLFSKAYEFGTEEQRHKLEKLSNQFKEEIEKRGKDPFIQAEAMKELTNELKHMTPNMYTSLEEFATEKTAKTFGNAAFNTYKNFKGKNVPITVIENPPAGMGLSTGEDIKNVVEKSRSEFVNRAVKEGMSEKQAKKEAEKLIGATWDVGHINMLRGKGYSEEEIVKETEKVKDVLKHVHLSDNFGFEHTELPMGMGNVPLKKMMEKLGKKGYEAKKIIEAGNWWQHFRTPPLQETLEGVGSPVYGMKMAPHWDQAAGLFQGYSSGYGMMLPQTHYESFGAGFSRLPQELGGSIQGGQGNRMSGRPME